MKNNITKKLLHCCVPLGLAMALIAPATGAPADANQKAKPLAEQLCEDLTQNSEAFQELVRRAMENGGKLQLDIEEFNALIEPQKGAEATDQARRFLEEMRVKQELMRLPGQSIAVDDEKLPDAGEAMKGFMELFQRRLKDRKVGKNEKEHRSILFEYRPVITEARLSTVALVADREPLALGTVVDSGGYVITKASEVVGKNLRCIFPGGVRVVAKVVDIYEPLDLALVKVGADGLAVADWAADGDIEPGTFLAAPGIGEDAIAIGVASVAPRTLSKKKQGFLGVQPVGTAEGVRLEQVHEGTPAAKAGLKIGDIVLEIDDTEITSRYELHRLISGRRPGEELKFKVRRGEDEKNLVAKLESREMLDQLNGGRQAPRNTRIDRMNQMGGELSDNREGYASAMQTDLTLEPSECGGPVVNLDGKVVGVNIARGGRVKSYAIPVADLRPLLTNVGTGRFSLTDLSELKQAAKAAGEAFKMAEAAVNAAREAKQAADDALEMAMQK
ncbi:MAG: serine protease Do [Verrucomicrobiales bacterium]|jgi:serine protease Do